LVLTDGQHRGRTGLAIPFGSATVIAVDAGGISSDLSGPFDAIVIDRSTFDPHEIEGFVQTAFPQLRPSGRLVIVFDSDKGVLGSPGEAPHLPGLRWSGVARLNGRPCAVMTADPDRASSADSAPDPETVGAPPGLLLATLAAGLRIAEGNHAATRSALDRARMTLAEELDDRHQSERELLDQVAGLVDELDRMRHQLTGANAVRTVLNQSKAGRVTLRALRPAWRLARGVGRRMRTRSV
jgi:hypothetical protein